jgi:hypothetical protein
MKGKVAIPQKRLHLATLSYILMTLSYILAILSNTVFKVSDQKAGFLDTKW